MTTRPGSTQRSGLIVLTWTMVMSTILYGAIVAFVFQQRAERVPQNPALRPVLWALAGGALLASATLFQRRLASAAGPGDVRGAAVLGLAVAEAAAIFGFVAALLGGAYLDFVIPAVGAIVVMLGVILPAAMRATNGSGSPGEAPPVDPG